MNKINLYLSGEYTKKNHTYHSEDSRFKWKNFAKILKKSNLNLNDVNSIVDVGCGGGQVIVQANNSSLFNNQCIFYHSASIYDMMTLSKFWLTHMHTHFPLVTHYPITWPNV